MKVELDKNGKLTILGETGVEEYALDIWRADFFTTLDQSKSCYAVLQIGCGTDSTYALVDKNKQDD